MMRSEHVQSEVREFGEVISLPIPPHSLIYHLLCHCEIDILVDREKCTAISKTNSLQTVYALKLKT